MQQETDKMQLFYEYYKQWIEVYKKGAIRDATMAKYLMTQKWVEKLAPELKVCELTRTAYQKLLNDYAKDHERQTTLDFHHQLKGAILDAVDEGMIQIEKMWITGDVREGRGDERWLNILLRKTDVC